MVNKGTQSLRMQLEEGVSEPGQRLEIVLYLPPPAHDRGQPISVPTTLYLLMPDSRKVRTSTDGSSQVPMWFKAWGHCQSGFK